MSSQPAEAGNELFPRETGNWDKRWVRSQVEKEAESPGEKGKGKAGCMMLRQLRQDHKEGRK